MIRNDVKTQIYQEIYSNRAFFIYIFTFMSFGSAAELMSLEQLFGEVS